MENYKISFIVLCGLVILIISIVKYRELTRYFKKNNRINSNILIFIKLNLMMMVFFAFGYIVVAVSLILEIPITNLIIGLIFFFGAIFVFSVIIVQVRMCEAIDKADKSESVKALINAIEARDKYTRGHSEHVANLCGCIYDKLPEAKRSKIDKNMLIYAGYLHDIGKVGISENILNKKEELNEEDWKIIKCHPLIGKKIIESIEQFSAISEWIFYHHERIDGKGYYGIKKDNIPLESMIISVADCFSALVTDRSYRKGKNYEEVIKIMKFLHGTQLEPKILDVFLNIEKNKIEKCKPASLSNRQVPDPLLGSVTGN